MTRINIFLTLGLIISAISFSGCNDDLVYINDNTIPSDTTDTITDTICNPIDTVDNPIDSTCLGVDSIIFHETSGSKLKSLIHYTGMDTSEVFEKFNFIYDGEILRAVESNGIDVLTITYESEDSLKFEWRNSINDVFRIELIKLDGRRIRSISRIDNSSFAGAFRFKYDCGWIDSLYEPSNSLSGDRIVNFNYQYSSGNCTGFEFSYVPVFPPGPTVYDSRYFEYGQLPYSKYIPQQAMYSWISRLFTTYLLLDPIYILGIMDYYGVPTNANLVSRRSNLNYHYSINGYNQVDFMFQTTQSGDTILPIRLEYY